MPTVEQNQFVSVSVPIIDILVSYDWYESEFGDGFFPSLEIQSDNNTTNKKSQYHLTTVQFSYNREKNIWKQIGGPNIDGLDGDQGEKFLKLLNTKGSINATKIYNSSINVLYPKC